MTYPPPPPPEDDEEQDEPKPGVMRNNHVPLPEGTKESSTQCWGFVLEQQAVRVTATWTCHTMPLLLDSQLTQ